MQPLASPQGQRRGMAAIRLLIGYWLLLPAVVIELYARRYQYAGMPAFPFGLLAVLSLAVLLMPPSLRARLPLAPRARLELETALVCATALLLSLQYRLQIVHVVIALLLLCLVLVPASLVSIAGWQGRGFRIAVGLALAALHFLMALYYAILLIGRETWNQIVSKELLWTYLWQLPDLIASLPIPQWIPYTVAAALFFSFLAGYLAFARRICEGLAAITGRAAEFVAPKGRIYRARLAAMGVVVTATVVAAQWLYLSAAYGAAPDPLVTTLFVKQDQPGSTDMPLNTDPQVTARDREVAAHYAPSGPIAGRTLVLITVDALRADQMNVYGHPRANTPFLSRLHREGKLKRFENVFSVCTESVCGLLAIHASRHWHQLGTANFGLTSALKRLGYFNEFLLSGDHTNYYGLRTFYGNSVDSYRDGSMTEGYSNDDRHVLEWLRGIGSAKEGGAPRFLYLHLMSVHILGKRFPEYRRWYGTAAGAEGKANCCSPAQAYANFYHDGILQADAMIEAIFGLLQAKGLLDKAIVVITADHGEALSDYADHGYFGHGGPPIDGEVRVPLLIYDTDLFPYPAHSLVSITDIAPTLLDRIGAPVPEHWTGKSLARPDERRFALIEERNEYAVIGRFGGELYKYRYTAGTEASDRLYNLSRDRGERQSLSEAEHPAIFKSLRDELQAEVPATRSPASVAAGGVGG